MSDALVPILVGVTGHRDIPEEDIELLRAAVRQYLLALKTAYQSTPLTLISGLAEGADRLVAEVALELGLSVMAALPMPQADYEQDFESPQSLEQFRVLLAKAESCYIVPQENSANGEASTQEDRALKYLALGHFIVRYAQIVIALWDGVSFQTTESGERKILTGGTADVVRLCREGMSSADDSLITPPETVQVQHLWVRRKNRPLPEGVVGQWAANEVPINLDEAKQNARTKTICCSINKFNSYILQLPPEQTQQTMNWLVGDTPPTEITSALNKPIACFAAADAAAGQRQIQRLKAMKWISGLAAISIICQQVYSGPDMRWGWLATHILLASLAFITYFRYFSHDNPREQQYFDWRSLAEALRVQVFWLAAGVKGNVADHYLSGDRDELDWIRQAARNVTTTVPSSESVEHLNWVRRAWLDSQYRYFCKKAPENHNKSKQYHRFTRYLVALGMVVTILTLFAHFAGFPDGYLNMCVLLSGISFLGAAMVKTFAEQMAFEEQENRYRIMEKAYQTALLRFDAYIEEDNEAGAQNVLLAIGKEALLENAAWLRMHRERQFEVSVG